MFVRKYKTFVFFVLAICMFAIFSTSFVAATTTYASLSVSHQTVPSTIEPGDKGNILLTIENTGLEYARSVELTLKAHSFVDYDKNSYKIGTIAPSNSAQVTIPVTIDENADEGVAALSFTLKYFNGQSSTYSTSENFISLQINKRAIVEIENVSYDKDPIKPGSIVKMDVKLENVGKSRINDLVVSLDIEDLPIVQIEGDSEKYLGDVATGTGTIAKFSLAIDKDAEIQAYSIPITLSYYDESGVLHTDEKYVGMLVSGEAEFVIALESTNIIYSNSLGDITISIANRGSSSAEALTAVFEPCELENGNKAGLETIPAQYYIGNLDPDDFETVSVSINTMGAKSGTYRMPIKLVYRDAYNTEYETEDFVELELSAMPPINIPLWMQVIGGAFIIFVLYWKRKFFMKILFRKSGKK